MSMFARTEGLNLFHVVMCWRSSPAHRLRDFKTASNQLVLRVFSLEGCSFEELEHIIRVAGPPTFISFKEKHYVLDGRISDQTCNPSTSCQSSLVFVLVLHLIQLTGVEGVHQPRGAWDGIAGGLRVFTPISPSPSRGAPSASRNPSRNQELNWENKWRSLQSANLEDGAGDVLGGQSLVNSSQELCLVSVLQVVVARHECCIEELPGQRQV